MSRTREDILEDIEEAGHKFGDWEVVDGIITKDKWNKAQLLVRCKCGTERIVNRSQLRGGKSTKCRPCASGQANINHGLSCDPIYKVWQSMIKRTSNPRYEHYHRYGGRGITVCDEWKNDVKTFIDWCASNGYKKGLQLDRIDNNGNYEPSNCRFITRQGQQNNTSRNIHLIAFGETKTLAEWSRDTRCTVSYGTLKQRIQTNNWMNEKAITEPSLRCKKANEAKQELKELEQEK